MEMPSAHSFQTVQHALTPFRMQKRQKPLLFWMALITMPPRASKSVIDTSISHFSFCPESTAWPQGLGLKPSDIRHADELFSEGSAPPPRPNVGTQAAPIFPAQELLAQSALGVAGPFFGGKNVLKASERKPGFCAPYSKCPLFLGCVVGFHGKYLSF